MTTERLEIIGEKWELLKYMQDYYRYKYTWKYALYCL